MTDMRSEVVAGLRSALRGPVLQPADLGYDEARRIWNAMIERRPALLARCAGSAICDDGLVIDLSAMRGVHIDPATRRAWVDGGAILPDVDHETQAFGLAVPLGISSTTGVAGLTLGGGFGWLSRMHGLSVDNLVGAEIVTADGQCRRIGPTREPELFWAIRGGGNFA